MQADTTEFRNNAGELIAIFQGDKIKASLIDVDNLVAKKVETSIGGNRIVIDPESSSIKFYDKYGRVLCEMSYYTIGGEYYSASIDLYTFADNTTTINRSIKIRSDGISCFKQEGSERKSYSLDPIDGLKFYKNGVVTKSYPVS